MAEAGTDPWAPAEVIVIEPKQAEEPQETEVHSGEVTAHLDLVQEGEEAERAAEEDEAAAEEEAAVSEEDAEPAEEDELAAALAALDKAKKK